MDNHTETSEFDELEGEHKAAILLGFLPLDVSQEIFSQLPRESIRKIVKSMTGKKRFGAETVEKVVKEYISYLRGNTDGLYESGVQRAIDIMKPRLSDEEIHEFLSQSQSSKIVPFKKLRNFKDIERLLTTLQNEDPQIISVIASFLRPKQAAALIEGLPHEKQVAVVEGVATMKQWDASAIAELNEYFEKSLSTDVTEELSSTNGMKSIVSIFNEFTRPTEKRLFTMLGEKDPDLADAIKENLFVFEDIVTLDNRSLQTVIMNIDDGIIIAKALKGAPKEIREHILLAMNQKRREALLEDEEVLGPIRREDVEEAQLKIANIVKELESKNEIVIQRGVGDVIL